MAEQHVDGGELVARTLRQAHVSQVFALHGDRRPPMKSAGTPGEIAAATASPAPGASAGPRAAIGASADAIVADIVSGLRSGRYSPGQRLPEPELMVRYGVSRGPVREAIRRLQAEGVVSLSRYRGASIRLFTRDEMIEILQLIEVLAGLAARLVAQKVAQGEGRDAFQATFSALMRLEDSPDFPAVVQARDDFFMLLIEHGGNRELGRVFPLVQLRMMRLQVTDSAVEATRFDDYRRIGQAILDGDDDAAEAATRRHLRSATAVFRELPMHR